jgi:hypothetical protein
MKQYAKELGTHANAVKELNPGLIVSCSDVAQVQSAVRFAQRCGYTVAIRGGGHSYSGLSSCSNTTCMQLDVSAINHTSVDGDLLTAGPGIRLIDFNGFMRKHGLSLPHGVCTGVGLGGHLQSSAYGPLSHAHGSGLDHVEKFKIVLANGSLVNVSRQDADPTLYRSILGSSPGSWGVITEYTVRGIRDVDVPPTYMIRYQYNWSRDKFVDVLRHTQFIAKDQEERNLRDMRVILFAAPPSTGNDTTMYIRVHGLWTGADSGNMTQEWQDRYLEPFIKLSPQEAGVKHPVPLSQSTILTGWENHNARYAMQDFISDHWWNETFLQLIGDEMAKRVAKMPTLFPSFQFNPLGHNSQWTRNEGMNSLTWRKMRAYADDWIFTLDEARYQEAVDHLRTFRQQTRAYWLTAGGEDTSIDERATWMSPFPNKTDLCDPAIAAQFFPNTTQFKQLRQIKEAVDPQGLFSNTGTIPVPGKCASDPPRPPHRIIV